MSESLLRTHVRDLRRVLGEALIETVVGRGYRFVAPTSDPTPVRGAAPAGAPRLELVRTSGTASAGTLKRLADALASLSTDATVVVIEYSRASASEPVQRRQAPRLRSLHRDR
jgi:hypothetical protein